MQQYIIITEIKSEANNVQWWMNQTDSEISTEIFDSFEAAKDSLRIKIKNVSSAYDFFLCRTIVLPL